MMVFQKTLDQWLAYIENLHSQVISLGLSRFSEVLSRLHCKTDAKIVTVAGTNGKGSTCVMMESIALSANYQTGCYLSPHLARFNERIRINGNLVSDEALLAAFSQVEAARQDTPLTFFEFTTLAAWIIFCDHPLDLIILEVGLGGRLDAVNAFDSDCAIVTSIGLDHMSYLGNTVSDIGKEKAGIFRKGCPAIMGITPDSVAEEAERIGAIPYVLGIDFGFSLEDTPSVQQWRWWLQIKGGDKIFRYALPIPGIGGSKQLENASLALAALDCLSDDLPVTQQDIKKGLLTARLAGRLQQISLKPNIVLDVAHNGAAALALAKSISQRKQKGQRIFVLFGLLSDKEMEEVIRPFIGLVDGWYVTALPSDRAQTPTVLADKIQALGGKVTGCFDCIEAAWKSVLTQVSDDDKIVVFGSFVLIGEIVSMPDFGLSALQEERASVLTRKKEQVIDIDRLLKR